MPKRQKDPKEIDALFASYLEFNRLGLRKEKKAAAQALVAAVSSIEGEIEWTRANFHKLPANKNARIQHEIYLGIIFPALRAGYENAEAESYFMLGHTYGNFMAVKTFANQIGWHSPRDFFERAYHKEPNVEKYGLALLGELLRGFAYAFHEWPSGILINQNDWRNELSELVADIRFARSLDHDDRYRQFLDDYLLKTNLYFERLSKRYLV